MQDDFKLVFKLLNSDCLTRDQFDFLKGFSIEKKRFNGLGDIISNQVLEYVKDLESKGYVVKTTKCNFLDLARTWSNIVTGIKRVNVEVLNR